ncbi:MAG TPA: PqqD family protein [Tenuifilaceae bacterium]|jgi:hypothetical protein|nr:PqqD family protein [Tenuifilaceae bacterium]
MVGFFQRRRILKNTSALDLIPIRIHEHIIADNGNVTILVPKFKNERFSRFFIPANRSKFISIFLDELGTAVWLAMDGVKSVGTICKELSESLGEKIYPAEERVVKFLSGLYHNKHITFRQIE